VDRLRRQRRQRHLPPRRIIPARRLQHQLRQLTRARLRPMRDKRQRNSMTIRRRSMRTTRSSRLLRITRRITARWTQMTSRQIMRRSRLRRCRCISSRRCRRRATSGRQVCGRGGRQATTGCRVRGPLPRMWARCGRRDTGAPMVAVGAGTVRTGGRTSDSMAGLTMASAMSGPASMAATGAAAGSITTAPITISAACM